MNSRKACRVALALGLLGLVDLSSAVAQEVTGGILQKVAVKPYVGLPYRLSARMKVDTAQSGGADAWLTTSVRNTNKRSGSFAYLPQKVTSNTWQTYSVAGRLDKQADTLTVFAGYYLNGRFAFDDFKLEVEQPKGSWQVVPLVNGGFEDTAPLSKQGLPTGWRQFSAGSGFRRQLVSNASGGQHLEVTGEGIVHYGNNRHAGRYTTANGVRLYYETYGQGEPLLLLHGNGESIISFSQQIGELAKEYRVIAVDTRDQGKSASTKGALNYDLFADDMHALLDTLHVPAAHILGWSDGGNTGLSMALRYPGQVKSLVTMGANLYADTTAVDSHMLRQVRQDQRKLILLSPLNKSLRRGARLTTMLLRYPQLTPGQLQTITAPVLVLAGEKDIIKEAHTRLIAQSIPRGQVLIFPGLTHNAPQENSALFNETVLAFLRRQQPGK